MKKLTSLVIAILAFAYSSKAQVDPETVKSFRHLLQLIQADNTKELSKLVEYPLKRTYPLPDIKNANEFIAYYPTLFDKPFKQLLVKNKNSEVWERNGYYSLEGLAGDIWMTDAGKIQTINYSSPAEEQHRQALIAAQKKQMHPSVSNWNENVVNARSEKLLVRIDRMASGDLRYACWGKGKTMKDAPDLILYKGTEEAQGTMGGWTWTFTNNGWTYIVDQVEMCDDPKYCGLFLELQYGGQTKSRTKLKEIP